jgi:hypothetical protein
MVVFYTYQIFIDIEVVNYSGKYAWKFSAATSVNDLTFESIKFYFHTANGIIPTLTYTPPTKELK